MTWKFEWDEVKRLSNLRKHDVDFIDAVGIFNDPNLVIEEDASEKYGEVRMIAIGTLKGQLVSVAFTERGEDMLRLTSARPATNRERKLYAASQTH